MDELELFAVADTPGAGSAPPGADRWRLFTDGVMGGVSAGDLQVDTVEGRRCLRLRGQVRLENNGGFVQIATDLQRDERRVIGDYSGVALAVYGNGETYNVHLRTEGMRHPWQSYRASFIAAPCWQTVRLPFAAFQPHRVEGEIDVAQVQRLGLVAIGRAFAADLCIASMSWYSD